MEGKCTPQQDMYATSASGLLCVGLAGGHNIGAERGHKTILKACVNINTHQSVVCEHKSQVIIIAVLYCPLCLLKGTPCIRGSRGSGFLLKGFHGNFGVIPGTHPLIHIL